MARRKVKPNQVMLSSTSITQGPLPDAEQFGGFSIYSIIKSKNNNFDN